LATASIKDILISRGN